MRGNAHSPLRPAALGIAMLLLAASLAACDAGTSAAPAGQSPGAVASGPSLGGATPAATPAPAAPTATGTPPPPPSAAPSPTPSASPGPDLDGLEITDTFKVVKPSKWATYEKPEADPVKNTRMDEVAFLTVHYETLAGRPVATKSDQGRTMLVWPNGDTDYDSLTGVKSGTTVRLVVDDVTWAAMPGGATSLRDLVVAGRVTKKGILVGQRITNPNDFALRVTPWVVRARHVGDDMVVVDYTVGGKDQIIPAGATVAIKFDAAKLKAARVWAKKRGVLYDFGVSVTPSDTQAFLANP